MVSVFIRLFFYFLHKASTTGFLPAMTFLCFSCCLQECFHLSAFLSNFLSILFLEAAILLPLSRVHQLFSESRLCYHIIGGNRCLYSSSFNFSSHEEIVWCFHRLFNQLFHTCFCHVKS